MKTYTVEDFRGMSMNEYQMFRSKFDAIETRPNIIIPSSGWTVQTLETPPFDEWQAARAGYIQGKIPLDELLLHVRLEDGDKYDELVLGEITAEKEAVSVRKHGFDWRRWAPWRWLVAWLHRGDLGRPRHG